MPKTVEGQLTAEGFRFAVIVSRFNDFISARLVEGAMDALTRHGSTEEQIDLVKVPGAFEAPLAAKKLASDGLAMLSQWSLPFPFVGLFAALASTVLITNGLTRDIALNGLIPLGTLYGVQGIVIAGHLFTKWALPPFLRIMILAFGIIAVPLATMIVVALGGLFDTRIDFRRRWPLEMKPSQPLT